MSFNVQSFHCTYNTVAYIHGAIPLAFLSPLFPLCVPSTYLAPSSCDRNRPPQSQVACKLTLFAPPFTQRTPSLQIPRTPTAQRLTKTTSGIFRLLLSGTWKLWVLGKLPKMGHLYTRLQEARIEEYIESRSLPYSDLVPVYPETGSMSGSDSQRSNILLQMKTVSQSRYAAFRIGLFYRINFQIFCCLLKTQKLGGGG